MSKRSNQDNFQIVMKKLRKLEKHLKLDRHYKKQYSSRCSSSSSSSSSSSENSMEESPEVLNDTPYDPNQNVLPQTLSDAAFAPQLDDQTDSAVKLLPSTSNSDDIVQTESTKTDFFEILGEDPSIAVAYGPEIHKEVASRFAYIATKGLDKEALRKLFEKFQIPNNCTNIAAPKLNAEVKAAITDRAVKRDKSIESRQGEIAAAISALGTIISKQLNNTQGSDKELMQNLMDLGRLLCDIQYKQSLCRRSLILNYVRKDLRDHLSSTNIEENLFGQNFVETIKTARAVSKSSSDLKPEAWRPPQFVSANSLRGNLNLKARSTARRQQTGQTPRHQQPAAARTKPMPQRRTGQPYSRTSKQSRRQ